MSLIEEGRIDNSNRTAALQAICPECVPSPAGQVRLHLVNNATFFGRPSQSCTISWFTSVATTTTCQEDRRKHLTNQTDNRKAKCFALYQSMEGTTAGFPEQ